MPPSPQPPSVTPPPIDPSIYLSFAEFRKSDENPRKFRHYMMLMQRGEGKMRKEGRIVILGKEQIRGKRGE
jgi:hypothetical protein